MGASLLAPAPLSPVNTPRKTVGYVPQETGPQTTLGRYRLIKQLGQGGMGTVYLAEHMTIGKPVAIKVLAREYADRAELRARFLQEARSASRIGQENVVDISDFGDTPDGSVFLVMELLEGEDLSATIAKGPISWPRAKHIILQICAALAAAHDACVVHRDMKPENVFRIKRGQDRDFVKVLDFGIAKVTSDSVDDSSEPSGPSEPSEPSEPKVRARLTKTGMIMGTPEYMSPEQASGMPVDARSDIYAVGVILYELLTQQVPFEGATFMAILSQHMFERPIRPSHVAPLASIPPELDAIVLKAMQKEPRFRFQSMQEMADAIQSVGTGTAAVEVIDEVVETPAPAGVATTFASKPVAMRDSQATTIYGAEASSSSLDLRSRRSPLALAGLMGMGMVLAGAGVFVAVSLWGPPSAVPPGDGPDPVVVRATIPGNPGPTVAGPAPLVAPPDLAPAPDDAHVRIRVTTPVEAKILDAHDGAIYGVTGDEGIVLEAGHDLIKLVLRAEGYEDLELDVIPDANKAYEPTLVAKKSETGESGDGKSGNTKSGHGKSGHGGKGGKHGHAGKGNDGPEDDGAGPVMDAATPVPPGNETGPGFVPPELRNPFGKRKKKPTG